MVALPVKLVFGVKVTLVAVKLASPLVGATPVIVKASPSGSLSFTRGSKVTGVFLGVDTTSATATGGWLVMRAPVGVMGKVNIPRLVKETLEWTPPLSPLRSWLMEFGCVAVPIRYRKNELVVMPGTP